MILVIKPITTKNILEIAWMMAKDQVVGHNLDDKSVYVIVCTCTNFRDVFGVIFLHISFLNSLLNL